jgi:FKBP-type peptidyl-prolyl cis-trans isomerase
MSPFRKIAIATSSLVILAGCESLPTAPTIFGGSGANACPDFATGSGPFTPPYPAACDTMKTTASGVKFIPLAAGDPSKGTPGPDATVVVNYEAFLEESGKRIDSSYGRGESSVYKVSDLIDGWGQAVQLMNPGDEWLVYVPSELAFGDEPLGDLIPADADLVYRIQLDGYLSAADLAAVAAPVEAAPEPEAPAGIVEQLGPDMAAWGAFFPWDASKPGVNTLDSGVSYVLLERGNSPTRNAVSSDSVVIHYEGRLAETSEFFDSSWSRGEPATFSVGGVIPGFTEILTFMRPGDRVLVHIPADQAYGADGAGDSVPLNADLMFQINLLQIVPAE